jgi:hypothetical protein
MEYVSRVLLDINGQSIDDFKSVTEKEVEINKAVNLMNKTGYIGVTPRYGVEVDYVLPESGDAFDFGTVKDGRLSIQFMNGKRVSYTGLYVLKIGDLAIDGEKEATKKITFGAVGRIEE